jgi:GntR family transcriptional regulator/MocR family aminotransferase
VSRPSRIITAGSQEGLNLVARLFVRMGRWSPENPDYQGAAFSSKYCAKLVPVPVDEAD